jgi:hypothetical protein
MCYIRLVDKTLTIRLDKSQDEALRQRAAALGRTRSQVVRDLIARELEERPLGREIGHLRGRVELPAPKTSWGRRIRERNWR